MGRHDGFVEGSSWAQTRGEWRAYRCVHHKHTLSCNHICTDTFTVYAPPPPLPHQHTCGPRVSTRPHMLSTCWVLAAPWSGNRPRTVAHRGMVCVELKYTASFTEKKSVWLPVPWSKEDSLFLFFFLQAPRKYINDQLVFSLYSQLTSHIYLQKRARLYIGFASGLVTIQKLWQLEIWSRKFSLCLFLFPLTRWSFFTVSCEMPKHSWQCLNGKDSSLFLRTSKFDSSRSRCCI